MYITLQYQNKFETEIEVDDYEVLDAGVILYQGKAFTYQNHPSFRQPVFVEQKVYHA